MNEPTLEADKKQLLVEYNRPASKAALDVAEAELNLILPGYLREFYLRHDGLQCYEKMADGSRELRWQIVGADRNNIQVEPANNERERREFLEFYEKYAGDEPLLAFVTNEFREWLEEIYEEEDAARFDGGDFPERYVCVAVHWNNHQTMWAKCGEPPDNLVSIDSPKFLTTEKLAACLDEKSIKFTAFLRQLQGEKI